MGTPSKGPATLGFDKAALICPAPYLVPMQYGHFLLVAAVWILRQDKRDRTGLQSRTVTSHTTKAGSHMSVSNFTRERPVVVIALSVGVCVVLPLIVSSQQAGRFFQSLGTGSDAVILFLTACAIIFSSPTIAVLSAHVAGSWLRVLAIVTCCLIAVFSVTTTTIAINNKTGNKINAEARQSETGRALSSSIAANIRAIEGLQEQIDARDPTRWATKRGQWADQIQRLQYQNMELIRQQKEHTENGSGSSTGETFARLAEWGITRFGFAVFAAFLLDLIPFVTCLIIGTMLARGIHRRVQGGGLYDFQEVPPTKKPQPQRAAA